MPIDNDYVLQMKAWVTSMEVTNQQTRNYIEFHKTEIDIHTRLLELYKEILVHDERRLDSGKSDFDKYIIDNTDENTLNK